MRFFIMRWMDIIDVLIDDTMRRIMRFFVKRWMDITRYSALLTSRIATNRFTVDLLGPLGLAPSIILIAERLLCNKAAARKRN
jgi:hypothetical protein